MVRANKNNLERPSLTVQDWWRYTLYTHIVGGAICLLSTLLQYSKILLKSAPSIHNALGYLFALSIITVVFPTGVALSFVAKGGTSGMIGFLVLSFATLLTMLLGITAILKGNIKKHKAWITRSFALVASAITFRILQISFFYAGFATETNYQMSLWFSILINAALAEYYLYKQKNKNYDT